jgi:broad specificity phosphatase PhoE
LKPDDNLQIFTSPYRRTRETTEGILKTLTARDDPNDPHATPSPFSRSKIKVYEEPRLREQDFGNFQPCSAEMERMWYDILEASAGSW